MKRISVFVILVMVMVTPNIVVAQGPGPTTPPYTQPDMGCIDAQEEWAWVEQIVTPLGGFVVFEPQGFSVVFDVPALASLEPRADFAEGYFKWPIIGHWYWGELIQINVAIRGKDVTCHYASFIFTTSVG